MPAHQSSRRSRTDWCLSVRTVESHLYRAMQKLAVCDGGKLSGACF
jgi:DNA-directed RNA polymerase specialized sigma24 family protein